VVAALATALGSTPTEFTIVVGAPAAQVTASTNPPSSVATGSSYIFAPIAIATANPDRPRSVGIKNFVLLIPHPDEDERFLVPRSTGTLVLTPLEEQIE
jgi:hypothetical protein